ncbi:Lysophospholipase L1 [Clostridium sp. DSM 8431]|uniref:SGNH/GDSL hydrolase family protein n=1 Tax=Clostridium sp. DSM 8431 TaxID=1761781 RepID=UPI0008F09C96|nr:SGNH/GDSL hydrolase family protein [Clostridium sp. DSM 8431]SFU31962.1 Lysophospholipase L1 [Clostridium sp. DSM 8431]
MKFLLDDNNVKVMGRTLYIDNVRYLNYSASAIEFEFVGKEAKVDICTNGAEGEEQFRAWMAVFINDKFYKRFSLDKKEDIYTLYKGEKTERIKLKLLKLSEASFGNAGIKSITIDSEEGPYKTNEALKKIEIIGDSITCGYGIEGDIAIDYFTTAEENIVKTYGYKVAEHFSADFNLISYSSKGIITSSIDKDIDDTKNTDWLMPRVYKYTDLGMSNNLNIKKPEVWDNKRFEADIIIINLGTNDATYTRDIKARIQEFGEGYYKFLTYLREHNKKAKIICTLGAMGQELCPEISRQVQKFKRDNDDGKVFFMSFDVQNKEDGIGTHEHPSAKTHERMAEKLIKLIEKI